MIYRKDLIKLGIALGLCVFLTGCAAGSASDFQSMLVNLQRSYPNLWRLLTATAYVLGFAMALRALYYLKIYGEARTMMSSGASIKTPAMYLLASTALIASPAAFHMINITFFSTPNPLHYDQGAVGAFTQTSIVAVIGLVQIIGLIAFIKGWLLLSRVGDQSSQPGTVGKSLTHIIGGAFAINVVQVWDVVKNTFGFS